VVYLAGSMDQPGGGAGEAAVLPPQAVPASISWLTVYGFDGAAGALRIFPDGTMYASGGGTADFTSLAGVSFPAAQSAPAGQALTLVNSWSSGDSDFGTGDPSYFVSGGIVHLSGSLVNYGDSLPVNGYFAVMPAAAQPGSCMETNVYTYADSVGWLAINPMTTDMYVQDEGGTESLAAAYTSRADISYPQEGTAWHTLTLLNGWTAGSLSCPDGPPSYYITNHVVYLSGALTHSQPGGGPFATLPLAARPTHPLYLTVNAEGQPYAAIAINPSGQMYLFGGNEPGWTSLSGIAYQESS